MVDPDYGTHHSFDINIHDTYSHGAAVGRNAIVRDFMKSDCDALWMIDADTVPPRNLSFVDAMEEMEYPVLCGPYKGFNEQYGGSFWHVYKKVTDRGYLPMPRKKWPADRFFKVDVAGTGCMLIRRNVIEEGRPDPFYLKIDSAGHVITEDMSFCKDVGGVWLDSHYVCKHERDVNLDYVKERP